MNSTTVTNATAYRLFENVLPLLQAAHREVREGRRFDALKVGNYLHLADGLIAELLGSRTKPTERATEDISGEGVRIMLERMVSSVLTARQDIFVPRQAAEAQGDPQKLLLCLQLDLRHLLDTATFRPRDEGGVLP